MKHNCIVSLIQILKVLTDNTVNIILYNNTETSTVKYYCNNTVYKIILETLPEMGEKHL